MCALYFISIRFLLLPLFAVGATGELHVVFGQRRAFQLLGEAVFLLLKDVLDILLPHPLLLLLLLLLHSHIVVHVCTGLAPWSQNQS